MSDSGSALDAEVLAALGERILELPDAHAAWVTQLFEECVRARLAEAEHLAGEIDATQAAQTIEQDLTQIVLDAAEWLRTLWEVGYMGGGRLPASPRSSFPQVEVEDVLKSALLARIRCGKRPLPFPPPTRHGVPWHEIVESAEPVAVDATPVDDEGGRTIAFLIDGDPGWDVLATIDGAAFRVQHRGKGPCYRLRPDAGGGVLEREAPTLERTIGSRQRGNIRQYTLAWPLSHGGWRDIPLRAASPERALSEAEYWVAREHPELYGQIRFALADGT